MLHFKHTDIFLLFKGQRKGLVYISKGKKRKSIMYYFVQAGDYLVNSLLRHRGDLCVVTDLEIVLSGGILFTRIVLKNDI